MASARKRRRGQRGTTSDASGPVSTVERLHWLPLARPSPVAQRPGDEPAFVDAHRQTPVDQSYACDSEDERFLAGLKGGAGKRRGRKRARASPVTDDDRLALERAIADLEAVAAAASSTREAMSKAESAMSAERDAASGASCILLEAAKQLGPRSGGTGAAPLGRLARSAARLTRSLASGRGSRGGLSGSPAAACDEEDEEEDEDSEQEDGADFARAMRPVPVGAVLPAMAEGWGRGEEEAAALARHWVSRRRALPGARRVAGALVRDDGTLRAAAASVGDAVRGVCEGSGVRLASGGTRVPRGAGQAAPDEAALRELASTGSTSALRLELRALRSLRGSCERARVVIDVVRRREKLKRAAALAGAEAEAAEGALRLLGGKPARGPKAGLAKAGEESEAGEDAAAEARRRAKGALETAVRGLEAEALGQR